MVLYFLGGWRGGGKLFFLLLVGEVVIMGKAWGSSPEGLCMSWAFVDGQV